MPKKQLPGGKQVTDPASGAEWSVNIPKVTVLDGDPRTLENFRLRLAPGEGHQVLTMLDKTNVNRLIVLDTDAVMVKWKDRQKTVLDLQRIHAAHMATRSTARLRRAVDWFPSPRTRKVLVKMVADQEALIAQLMIDGRVNTARWQIGVTWLLLAYTGTLHFISSLASAIRGKQRTN